MKFFSSFSTLFFPDVDKIENGVYLLIYEGRDSSVGVETGYGLDGPEI
jgi:hypothetical protein